MATASFLTSDQLEWAAKNFTAQAVNGGAPSLGKDLSLWLDEKLLEVVEKTPRWKESRPIALGSWGRQELCPRSDIDLLFLGEEDAVREVMRSLQQAGLKVRSRLPADHSDWTQGVDAFDVLALLRARAFDEATEQLLKIQQQEILRKQGRHRANLRRAIAQERKARQSRYDSIANYLEPNIKYGTGGLRDLQQALDLRRLFIEKFQSEEKLEQDCMRHRGRLLAIRQRLHLLGAGDILEGPLQEDIAKFFGYSEVQDFMRDLQLRLSDIHFFASWVFYRSRLNQKQLRTADRLNINSGDQALRTLSTDPSLEVQKQIREKASKFKLPSGWWKAVSVARELPFLEGLMDAHLLDCGLPDIGRIRGLVQLDHYHRFTVDAHIRQAMRTVKRIYDRPSRLDLLAGSVRAMKPFDWQVLIWTALFHDLAKGKGGDHSTKGQELAAKSLASLGAPDALADEVAWMVENHLLLSTAAFRLNIQDPEVWRMLQAKGAVGNRLVRLAVFTAVDIQATNPEAWTSWKERLLFELVKMILSPQTSGYLRLQSEFKEKAGKWIDGLDPNLLSHLSPKVLLADLKAANAGKSLPPKIVRTAKGETWIRFHESRERRGQFLDYVARLFAVGCSIRHSSIQTLEGLGVYDWFHVRCKKTPAQILKQLQLLEDSQTIAPPPKVRFQRVDLVSRSERDAVLGFRGIDQRGMLLTAALALYDAGFSVRWAKVHTWGQQVDDIFCVNMRPTFDQDLQAIRSLLVEDSAASYQV